MTNTLPAAADTTTNDDAGAAPEWTPIAAAQLQPGQVIRQGATVGEVRAVEPVDYHPNRLKILYVGGSHAEPRCTDFYELATEPAAARWREQQTRARRQRGLGRALIGLANMFDRDQLLPPPAWKLLIYCDVATGAEVEQFAATLGVDVEITEHMVRAVFEDELVHLACGTPRLPADPNGER